MVSIRLSGVVRTYSVCLVCLSLLPKLEGVPCYSDKKNTHTHTNISTDTKTLYLLDSNKTHVFGNTYIHTLLLYQLSPTGFCSDS